jgi:hypothetical protein
VNSKPKLHTQSVDGVTLSLQTGLECAVELVSVPKMLGGLLLCPLLISFLFPSDLVRTSHAAQQSTGAGADGRTSSGIPGDSPSNHSDRCTADTAADQPALGRFTRRRRLRGPGCRQRIESCLLPGPNLTFDLVSFHLLLALPLTGKDKEILCRGNCSKSEKDEKENGISYCGPHYGLLSMTMFRND